MENEDGGNMVDLEMADITTNRLASESDEEIDFETEIHYEAGRGVGAGSDAASDAGGEYGELTLAPNDNVVANKTKSSSIMANNRDFYRSTVRRQNCCFGISMISVAGAFLAAYLLMGLSFSPSNIGIFGDESSLKGGSGKMDIVVVIGSGIDGKFVST